MLFNHFILKLLIQKLLSHIKCDIKAIPQFNVSNSEIANISKVKPNMR